MQHDVKRLKAAILNVSAEQCLRADMVEWSICETNRIITKTPYYNMPKTSFDFEKKL